jgi:hypothetical protein
MLEAVSAGFQRTAGWIAIVIFAGIAVLLLAVGWIHTGWASPDYQCISGPMPADGGPYYETTNISGSRIFFPLGVDCTYEVAGDGFGPQTVHNYNLAPTLALIMSVLGIVVGALFVKRAALIERVRGL